MGTHSLIRFKKRYTRGKKTVTETICAVYQQYDGYPDGVGQGLLEFLTSQKLCSGIPPPSPATSWANGIECLAAQYVPRFKTRSGNLYIYAPTAADEDYTYEVEEVIGEDYSQELAIRVIQPDFDSDRFEEAQQSGTDPDSEDFYVTKELFSGSLSAYSAWLKEQESA